MGATQRQQQRLAHVARADDPRGDAVDAGVKVIQADAHAAGVAAPDDLLRDGLQVVGEGDHVVAVPAHAAADVQRDLRQVAEHGGNLVRDAFGRMVMAGIQREQDLAG